MPKAYQEKIIKRALTDKEFQELDKKYRSVSNIKAFLVPATTEEKKVLASYLKQEIGLDGVRQSLNIPIGSTGNKVRTIALKILAEKYCSLKRSDIKK